MLFKVRDMGDQVPFDRLRDRRIGCRGGGVGEWIY